MGYPYQRAIRNLRETAWKTERLLANSNCVELWRFVSLPQPEGQRNRHLAEKAGLLDGLVGYADMMIQSLGPVGVSVLISQLAAEDRKSRPPNAAMLYFLMRNNPLVSPPNVDGKSTIGHISAKWPELAGRVIVSSQSSRISTAPDLRKPTLSEQFQTVAQRWRVHALRSQPDWWMNPTIQSQFSRRDWLSLLADLAWSMPAFGLEVEARHFEGTNKKDSRGRLVLAAAPTPAQHASMLWYEVVSAEVKTRVHRVRGKIAADFGDHAKWSIARFNLSGQIYSVGLDSRTGELDILAGSMGTAASYLAEYDLLGLSDPELIAERERLKEEVASVEGQDKKPTRYEMAALIKLRDTHHNHSVFRNTRTSRKWQGRNRPASTGAVKVANPSTPANPGHFSLVAWVGEKWAKVRRIA